MGRTVASELEGLARRARRQRVPPTPRGCRPEARGGRPRNAKSTKYILTHSAKKLKPLLHFDASRRERMYLFFTKSTGKFSDVPPVDLTGDIVWGMVAA